MKKSVIFERKDIVIPYLFRYDIYVQIDHDSFSGQFRFFYELLLFNGPFKSMKAYYKCENAFNDHTEIPETYMSKGMRSFWSAGMRSFLQAASGPYPQV